MAGRTQEALYAEIDLELSWSEDELPQVERTKHVHGLHPYLGKFIPQLVEVFLRRHFPPGQCVYDPFVGSGTTLVEANVFGADAVGCDISAFNCLLTQREDRAYSLGKLELGAARRARERRAGGSARGRQRERRGSSSGTRRRRCASCSPTARPSRRLMTRRVGGARHPLPRGSVGSADDALRSRLPRGADDRRRTGATSTSGRAGPSRRRGSFSRRYTTRHGPPHPRVRRRADGASVDVLHDDARTVASRAARRGHHVTAVPRPDRLPRAAPLRLRAARPRRPSRATRSERRPRAQLAPRARATSTAMSAAFENARRQLRGDARVLIVVNDSQELYPRDPREVGLALEERITRHVNRRTGRRAGEFFEDVLICRPV